MKKLWVIAIIATVVTATISCNNVRRNPGRAYMPDMAYSRAYETYAETEGLKSQRINYNGLPVAGTIAQGDMLQIYTVKNDSLGYIQSGAVTNPVSIDSIDKKEAERLYLVNCGVCHGAKLDGNGPLWNDGNGAYPAAPKNLLSDEIKKQGEGTYFHVMTYGKGQMGSYASQLSTLQRWMVAAYVKSKQGAGAAADTSSMSTAAADTTKK